ncbi:MAG TPA: hypothetical protein VK941_06020 [Gillisia sp.]|nr:hypothetical protein [Gillisia sp.]
MFGRLDVTLKPFLPDASGVDPALGFQWVLKDGVIGGLFFFCPNIGSSFVATFRATKDHRANRIKAVFYYGWRSKNEYMYVEENR